MLTVSTRTNTKGPKHQNIRKVLEISKSLKTSEIGPREGGKLTRCTPKPHGQSSCNLKPTYCVDVGILDSKNMQVYVIDSYLQ